MSNCLDCPDPQNYAAIALQLQETALQAEACLYEVETALRQVTNPETILFTTTAAQNVAPNILTRIGVNLGVTTFSNTPRINMLASVPWTPGVYEVGACITAAPTGAVTADSYRELYIAVRRPGDPLGSPSVFYEFTTLTEPNDGVGIDMTNNATVVISPGDEIQFMFRHGNTGSIVGIAIGALFWAVRVSDATALRVV